METNIFLDPDLPTSFYSSPLPGISRDRDFISERVSILVLEDEAGGLKGEGC